MTRLRSAQGFSMIEMMVALAVVGLIAYLGADAFVAFSRRDQITQNSQTVLKLRADLVALIQDEEAWRETIAANSGAGGAFACWNNVAGCGGVANVFATFVPRTASGALYKNYNPGNATDGFDIRGQRCVTFTSPVRNDLCPFRFTFERRFRCDAGQTDCYRPVVEVRINFVEAVLNAPNTNKFIGVRHTYLDAIVIKQGEAKVVTPHVCPAGQVVRRIEADGTVICGNL